MKKSEIAAQKAARHAMEHGGATLHPADLSLMDLSGGYWVSVKGFERVVALPIIDRDQVAYLARDIVEFNEYLKERRAKLPRAYYLGIWIDRNRIVPRVVFDATVWRETLEEAVKFGRDNDQEAICDIADGYETVYIK